MPGDRRTGCCDDAVPTDLDREGVGRAWILPAAHDGGARVIDRSLSCFEAGTRVKTSLDRRALAEYLERQLATWFPDGNPVALENVVPRALDRLALCFAPVKLGMYR